jgi:ABC transport system ATP-binding/permease protein
MTLIILTAEQLNKSYVERPLLKDVSLTISEGDKIGIIGVNGTGKSTFLKIIAGVELPDSGKITAAGGMHIGYLPQNPVFEKHSSVWEQVLANAAEGKTEVQEYECKAILTKLGITDFEKDVNLLSGGQKKRVAMAAALAGKVDLLILDEPTNHIDNEMVCWLENYLARYNGAILMVTHDRYFLEKVTNRIVELQDGVITAYPANYSKYLELKAQREDMVAASERKRQTLLRKELAWIQRGARARSTKAQFRVNRYEELSSQNAPEEQQKLQLSSISSRLGKKIIEIDGISKSYAGRVLFHDFSYNLMRDDRLGLIGPNGCGKSTLLKILVGLITPDTGTVSVGETVKIGYFSQESEEMDTSLRVIDYITSIAEQIATPEGMLTASQMLEKFLFPSDLQYTTIGRLSGGERRRLFLLKILVEAPNVLFLDEPTNDLDIQTLTILEDYLEGFAGAVIAVSHDRYFLDKMAGHLFAFQPDGTLAQYLGGYSAYMEKRTEEIKEPVQESEATSDRPKGYRQKSTKLKFTFKEQREFDKIDSVIEGLEQKVSSVQTEIESQTSNFEALQELLHQKEELEKELAEKTDRWVYLNDLAEQIENQ